MTEMIVAIYRRDVTGPKYNREQFKRAPTKAQITEAELSLDLICRVRRPSLEAFLRRPKGGFYDLPALSPKIIDNRGLRLLKHRSAREIIATDSLGRSGEATRSAVESIRLWIAHNMGHVVNPDHIAIVFEQN